MQTIRAAILSLFILTPVAALAIEADFSIHVVPAAVLMDFGSDDFSVTTVSSEESPSSIYSLPNVNLGVGINTDFGYIDVNGGAGLFFNDSLRSITLQADVSLQFSVARSLTIGPHLGAIYFTNPTWTGSADLDFDKAGGFLGGIRASMGDKITYTVSVDMLQTKLDTTYGTGIETDSSLDIQAVGIQFGVRGEF